MKRIIFTFALLWSWTAFAFSSEYSQDSANTVSHLQTFIELVNKRSFSNALNEMQHITDWSYKENEHKFDIMGLNAYITHSLYTLNTNDSLLRHYHFDSLCVYLYHDFDRYIRQEKKKNNIENAILLCQHLEVLTSTLLGADYLRFPHLLETQGRLFEVLVTPGRLMADQNRILQAGDCFCHSAHFYERQHQYKRAEANYNHALRLLLENNYVKTDIHARCFNLAANFYNNKGDWERAEKLMQLSHAITGTQYNDSTMEFIMSLYAEGCILNGAGKYEEAIPLIEKAIELLNAYYPEEKEPLGTCYALLGKLHTSLGKYDEAQDELLKGIEIIKSSSKEPTESLGIAYVNLGGYLDHIGYYSDAIDYFHKAQKIYRQVLPDWEFNDKYLETLFDLGQAYYHIGDTKEAIKQTTAVLQVIENLYGKNHIHYANALQILANIYKESGDIAKADELYQEAFIIQQKVLPDNHPYKVTYLQNASLFYSELGDDKKAEKYIEQAIEMQKNICDSTIDYAFLLISSAHIYQHLGKIDKAGEAYRIALPIIADKANPESNKTISALDSYASFCAQFRDIEDAMVEAEESYLLAISLMDSAKNRRADIYATVCNDLGLFYLDQKRYDDALHYHMIALDSIQRTSDKTRYALSLSNIGMVYDKMGDFVKAEEYLCSGADIIKNLFLESWDYMTEQMRENYWKQYQSLISLNIPTIAYQRYSQYPQISQRAYDNELFLKGALITSTEAIKRSIEESGDTILQRQWQELTSMKREVLYMQEQGASVEAIEKRQNQAEQLEKKITRSSAVYREKHHSSEISCNDVKKALKPDEVAIEFFMMMPEEDSLTIGALVLRNNSDYPELISLFSFNEIAELFEKTSDGKYSYLNHEKEVSSLVWSKLLPYLKPQETVYFAATNILCQIAIENLPYDSTLSMCDQYNLVRLSSTREIVKPKQKIKYKTATLYGDIYYQDLDSSLIIANQAKYATAKRDIASYLYGTKKEIETIQPILERRNISVTTHTKRDACEESVKALSGKKQNIIHLATHGFFYQDSTYQSDPMERCGLLFAGANTSLREEDTKLNRYADDGILTAKEISLLDLQGTDLVVLSACETGLGDVIGDVTYGLQRAFKLAGANTIIMSLWPVYDEATQMFMSAFYHNWIIGKQSKREAFRNAQKAMRNKYKESEKWAGFIILE